MPPPFWSELTHAQGRGCSLVLPIFNYKNLPRPDQENKSKVNKLGLLCRHSGRRDSIRQEFILLRKRVNLVELVHSNGFNSPSMVGINSETVG